jgi:hypothetical protein
MKNKKILIGFALVLLVAVGGLIIYAYSLSQNTPSSLEQLSPAEIAKPSENIQPKETNAEKLTRLEKIKREMSGITNDSFTIETLAEDEEDCSTEESIEYEEEIVTGVARVAEGLVIKVNTSSLLIEFKQGSSSWQSTVKLDQNSSIQNLSSDLNLSSISLSDIQVGDRVVTKTSGNNITEESFVAIDVTRME